MKIALIGPGYVGFHLLTHWENPEDRFFPLTTTPEKVTSLEQLPQVTRVFLHQIEEAIPLCDGVIVCIAPKEGASYEETYLHTAQSLERHLTPETYLLYTSSTSVYGPQDASWIDEKTVPSPLSSRGKLLLETEQVYLNSPATTCILRLAGIYGPGRALGDRAQRFSGREIAGSGNQPTNHTHVEDISRAIGYCFRHKLSGIYNLVSDAHPTRAALYAELCQEAHLPPPTWNPDLPQTHGSNSCISSQKIKQAGFQFSHPTLR